MTSPRTDLPEQDPKDALEQALMAIHGIADVLYAISEARDIVMPRNGISYLSIALEDAYEKAQGAFAAICYPQKPGA